ncbi:MAG: proline--tRNA ligase, partial [Candidatus Aegiribacteria sp.]|nr:proline--tRNA ligase [Candidatus Aegiribacteria sp.]
TRARIMEVVNGIRKGLEKKNVRVEVDDREGSSPGFKFNYWEVRGVPVRLEIGPRDLEEGHVMVSPRNNPGRDGKYTIPLNEVVERIPDILDSIQSEMLEEATEKLNSRTYEVETLEEFKKAITEKPGFYRVWWAGDAEDEAELQSETKATVRCIPLDQPQGEKGKCIITGKETETMAILARAY